MITVTHHALTADSHLLKLLGDGLIGNDRLAIFELVKNAYDADATEVHVEVDLQGRTPRFRIRLPNMSVIQKVRTPTFARVDVEHV